MYADFVPHGFRSAFRYWAPETNEYSNETVELNLAHTIQNIAEAAYRRQDQLEKRARLMGARGDLVDKKIIHFFINSHLIRFNSIGRYNFAPTFNFFI